jgi:two-component system, chemotaxis family, chemotaxis protein CheY
MTHKRPRILIVEDSPAMRQLLAIACRRLADVVIDQAGDGLAALKAMAEAGSDPYDLVLLDLNMPVMDGMKVLGKMHEDGMMARTTVCVCTTEESEETEKQARALGARYFVRKPVNRRTVEKVLEEVFSLPAA